MGEVQPEVYILGRDAEESACLNAQNDFLLALSENNLIHPSIPKDNIHAVAEIATGTGIWLRDAASVLSTQNPNPPSPYYLHGFDNLASAVPAAPNAG